MKRDEYDAADDRWNAMFAGLKADAPPVDPSVLRSIRCSVKAAIDEGNPRPFNHLLRWAGVVASVAAVIGVIVWIAVDSASPAYGVQDVPDVMAQAKTLHVRAVRYIYEPDERFPGFERAVLCPMEWWVDFENDRSRLVSFLNMGTGQNWITGKVESVSAGGEKMDIDHQNKRVTFIRRSPIAQKLESRKIVRQAVDVLGRQQLAEFSKVGREQIDGKSYDIWERTQQLTQPYEKSDQALPDVAVRCWVSPETGELARVHQLVRSSADLPWRPEVIYDVIECDVAMPDELFTLAVPEGFEPTNARDKPQLSPLQDWRMSFEESGGVELIAYVGFTLDDGSVILGWGLKESKTSKVDFGRLIALRPGDPLPALPVAITDLTSLPPHFLPDDTRWYAGRHLATTRKNQQTIEWTLFIPRDRSTTSSANSLYFTWLKFEGLGDGVRRFNPIYCDRIGDTEFEEFVLGAMRELSDEGAVPKVTLESVKQLTASLQKSIDAAPPTTMPGKQAN